MEVLDLLLGSLLIFLDGYYRKDDDYGENNGCHLWCRCNTDSEVWTMIMFRNEKFMPRKRSYEGMASQRAGAIPVKYLHP